MRSLSALAIPGTAILLASCGARYKPHDPVLTGYERAYRFPVERSHEQLIYSGNPSTGAPIVPFLAFGAAFDLDFVVMPKEGDTFDMLEFARYPHPNGPVWVALETLPTGDQTMIANMDRFDEFMPEIPISRQKGDLVATDRSTESTLDVSLTYTNSKGQKVEANLLGDPPEKFAKRRNGNTFDHSANQLLAVLDIPSSDSLFKADVAIDGRNLKFKKIAGIVPAQFVLEQIQGGVVSGAYTVVPGEIASGSSAFGKLLVTTKGEPPTAKPPPEMQVKMGVAKQVAGLKKCWTDRVATPPVPPAVAPVGGKVEYSFVITKGVVSGAAAVANAEPGAFVDADLNTCVVTAIGGWSFDASVSGSVTWPFTFVAGDVEEETDPMVELGVGALIAAPDETVPNLNPEALNPEALTPEEAMDGIADPASFGSGATPKLEDITLNSFTSIHNRPDGSSLEMKWLVTRQGNRVVARQTSELRSLVYTYRIVADAYLELVTVAVEQYGRATPVTAITFNPPIPDLRWRFGGKRTSSFVIDVNGQQSHAVGEVEAWWAETGPKVRMTPAEPTWAKERPLLTTINYPGDGSATVKVERIGD